MHRYGCGLICTLFALPLLTRAGMSGMDRYVSDQWFRGNRLLAVGPCCIATGLLLVVYPMVSHWGSATNCIMLFLIGFFIAGPDSVLGGAATADACERQGATHLLTTAGGISNGMGSLGSMVQGPVSSAAVGR